MAILAVKIDHLESLWMNEFFDYNGHCWALSRDRKKDAATAVELEDFYEGTVRSSQMQDVPVVFICEDQIVGWYKKATVYRYLRHPALFLEGNICASIRDVRVLKTPKPYQEIHFVEGKNYTVIESADQRFQELMGVIEDDTWEFEVIEYAKVLSEAGALRRAAMASKARIQGTTKMKVEALLSVCEMLAQEIMEDHCSGMGRLKAFAELALEATRYEASNVNGWYYLAMAYEQLGFVKKGLKAIDRALKLETNADDLYALKGNLMVSGGWLEEALHCYEKAYALNPEDCYYIMAGRACACMGNPMAADSYYRKVKDKDELEKFEITLKKKKPF